MGQYHKVVNLDKKEYLHPHKLGDGLKLLEFGPGGEGTMAALAMLLAAHSGRGGGDFGINPLIGSWAGDRIAIVGDYADELDAVGWDSEHGRTIYESCSEGTYRDISDDVRALFPANDISVRQF